MNEEQLEFELEKCVFVYRTEPNADGSYDRMGVITKFGFELTHPDYQHLPLEWLEQIVVGAQRLK